MTGLLVLRTAVLAALLACVGAAPAFAQVAPAAVAPPCPRAPEDHMPMMDGKCDPNRIPANPDIKPLVMATQEDIARLQAEIDQLREQMRRAHGDAAH